ncbi:MAG TPA: hypothetical protein VLH58_12975 [Candidatus Methylomirabilis sp.]|nr:hypothetical protein [Candidatus Methylomirabilis sp.]HSC72263.1 hypothetical protein [Candidatus Methylomirabilis sp.]
MTNTLHRFGAPETLQDDYIVFAMAARGINDQDAPPKLQTFLRLALKHHPINIGNAVKGGIFRPSPDLTPLAHWRRPEAVDPDAVVKGIDACTTVAAVFDNMASLEAFLANLKQADLGLSINVASLTDNAHTCCRQVGLTRHSVGYSLGFHGDLNLLPDRPVLELSTMCGHGMVSHNFAKKMVDWVKEGRRDPKQAATYMARFCTCGVFNPTRATRILEEMRTGK